MFSCFVFLGGGTTLGFILPMTQVRLGRTVEGFQECLTVVGRWVVRLVRMVVQVCAVGSTGGTGLSCTRCCPLGPIQGSVALQFLTHRAPGSCKMALHFKRHFNLPLG